MQNAAKNDEQQGRFETEDPKEIGNRLVSIERRLERMERMMETMVNADVGGLPQE